jgi:hypothetical protein
MLADMKRSGALRTGIGRSGAMRFAGAVVAVTLSWVVPTQAQQLTNAGIFKNLTHEQTGPSTVVATGAFFNAGGIISAPGAFNQATLTYPNGTQILPFTSPTVFGNGPGFSSQAAMDAAYPIGSYTITVTNTGTSATDSRTVTLNPDAYTPDIPQLTAASFTALQNLSTSGPALTLDFNGFTPNPLATAFFTYFTIFNSSQFCSGLSPSATSCTINPDVLTPGTTYDWELDFSDRIEATVNGALTYTDFDVRTDGTFTTAVPEPTSIALLGAGLFGLFVQRRRSSV